MDKLDEILKKYGNFPNNDTTEARKEILDWVEEEMKYILDCTNWDRKSCDDCIRFCNDRQQRIVNEFKKHISKLREEK